MPDLSLEDGVYLISFARKAIERYLKTGERLSIPPDVPEKFKQRCGVFVTLNSVRGGAKELRGCIGFPEPTNPLLEAVRDSAINSATSDPRFHPLSLNELKDVLVEVSVLTPPQLIEVEDPMQYPRSIKVGKDGLIIERGWNKGLLLPQVAVEWRWNEEDFLSNCCIKAGLPPDAWLLSRTKVYKFQAIVFEEEEPGGKVRRAELKGIC
jgi:hypothetical protein